MTQLLSWGVALSSHAHPLLQRLLQAGLIDSIALPPDGERWRSGELGVVFSQEWPHSRAVVAVGACGAVTRLIAPLLQGKHSDPAVVVLDPLGRFAVPLLGGHAAGPTPWRARSAHCSGARLCSPAAVPGLASWPSTASAAPGAGGAAPAPGMR